MSEFTERVDNALSAAVEMEDLNVFISLDELQVRNASDRVVEKMENGSAGKLAGSIVAVKDLICTEGVKTTCGSRILRDFVPPYDATVISKLKEADALILGKTNMDEFAMGSSNENSAFGPVRNPKDKNRVPGGSSGGSAAAVAAGIVDMALGSDTGGSIRQPAAFCGVVGIKPTYGRVSRYGLVAFASSLDQIGPLASNVRDCARLLEVIAGHDENDSTSADVDVPAYSTMLDGDIEGSKIGLPKEYFGEGCDGEILAKLEWLVEQLRSRGAEVKDVSLPHTEYSIAAYYIIATAEASSNLARYDGMRYGSRVGGGNLRNTYKNSRSDGFGEEVKRRIMLGTYVLSAGYYDAYYKKAQQVRRLIRDDFNAVFEEYDFILTPTSPTTAFNLGSKVEDPLAMYLSDVYTTSLNLAGLPGLSVPCGESSEGLPIGVQVIGSAFDETGVLRLGAQIEEIVASA